MPEMKPWFAPDNELLLLGQDALGHSCSLRVRVPPRSAHVEMVDSGSGRCVDVARYSGHAFAGDMIIPTDCFASSKSLFAKLDRSSWFFDEAGWLEVPALAKVTGASVRAPTGAVRAIGVR